MPELNVELLEQSFQAVAPRGEELATRFYDVLFERYPVVQPLLAGTTREKQEGKLLAALALTVGLLRQPDELVPFLQGLGARHTAYGAVPAYYDAVGEVLLEVLAEVAGDAWTPEVAQAWADAYATIKSVMLDGARQAESAA